MWLKLAMVFSIYKNVPIPTIKVRNFHPSFSRKGPGLSKIVNNKNNNSPIILIDQIYVIL